MKRIWVVALLAVVACKDKKAGRHHDDDDDAGGCKLAADAKPADMATGKTAQIPKPLDTLKLGMSPADAKAACPNLFKGEKEPKTGTFSVGEIIGKFGTEYVHGRLQFTADKLTAVEITAPPAIADALTAAWGAPQSSAGKATSLAWFDDATSTRAMLGPDERGTRELKISTYVPLEAFVEQDTKRIAFKPADVLGKTPAELVKQFPQFAGASTVSESTRKATDKMMEGMKQDLAAKGVKVKEQRDDVEVRLPASPLGADAMTHVILYLNDDNTVRSYGVWFHTEEMMSGSAWPAQAEQIVKLFDAKWGPHKMVKETLGDRHTWFDPKAGIRASTHIDPSRPGDLDIVYVRYTPLATLFGSPGELWGFEKQERPILGATSAELAATYGKQLEAKPDGETATLRLPPTDYDGDTSQTTVLVFIRDGIANEWHLGLPFGDYEPARAEYEAALEAKLGKPKPGRNEHATYGKHTDVRFSDITHDVDLEVTK